MTQATPRATARAARRGAAAAPGTRATLRLLAAVALLDALTAATVLGIHGTGEPGLLALNRALVRIGFPLFALAFSASALHGFWPAATTRWLLRNRRGMGLSFALAHFAHGLAIVAFFSLTERSPAPTDPTVIVGGIGFVLIAAMAATSSDAAVHALGPGRWRGLHLTGGWVVWFAFTATYAGRVAEGKAPFALALAACLGVLGLRAAAHVRRRRLRPAASAAAPFA